MAGSFNQVILLGNLTRDVELKYTPNNTAVGTFAIATNRSWTTPTGEKREEVMYIDCEAWGKTAEMLKQYVGKGRKLFVQGRIKLDQWKDKNDGSNRSKHRVVVEEFRFVDSRPGGGGPPPGADESTPSSPVQTRSQGNRAPAGAPAGPSEMDGPEPIAEGDIPF